MSRSLPIVVLLVSLATPAIGRDVDDSPALRIARDEGVVLTSSSTTRALLMRESAGPDTFDLYGGPLDPVRDPDGIPGNGDEYLEGKFEAPFAPVPRGLGPSPGNWTGVDLTEVPLRWHVDTFNAETLGGHGAGNRAMWCGHRAENPLTAGWTDAPGYGNNWNEVLLFEQDVTDPASGQVVDLDFVFHHDTEPAYDFFYVEYDSAGSWVSVLTIDGTNKVGGVFPAPGVRFSDVAQRAIVYAGDDYGGFGGPTIRIRLRFFSDGGWSDEDGSFVGDGAVQVDDVVITTTEGTATEDFEGDGPYVFEPERPPFFGDFSNLFVFTSDLDPCRENRTPQVNFVDFGQAPPNGPGVTGIASTGGTTSPLWNYGSPGGYVVNYLNGISGSYSYIANEVWSPVIEWDLPGIDDDDPAFAGLKLEFDVWSHAPLDLSIFYVWRVRFYVGGEWTEWRDRNFVYFGGAVYRRGSEDISDLVEPGTERVQIALGVTDLSSLIFFPPYDATPGPWFDNVRLSKFRVDGPVISVRETDLAHDAFPVSGTLDVGTPAARDALDVRFDRGASLSVAAVPGDSVVAQVASVIPGATVDGMRLVWALRQNAVFEADLRTPPARPGVDVDFAETFDFGRTVWRGAVLMAPAVGTSGVPVPGSMAGDLPDEDFLYPGDVLHYYLEATDSDGRVSTMPADLTGFGDWDPDGESLWPRRFTVRALPSIDASGDTPPILLIHGAGETGRLDAVNGAFEANGYREGVDFDAYTARSRGDVGNGIGDAGRETVLGERRGHGASLTQMLGYDTVVYDFAWQSLYSLGTGSEPSTDLGLLTSWWQSAGRRGLMLFGDSLVSDLRNRAEGLVFLEEIAGVEEIDDDVAPLIGASTSLRMAPIPDVPALEVEFAVVGSCPHRAYDAIRPGPGAYRASGFLATDGTVVPELAACVVHSTEPGPKTALTFPFGIDAIVDDLARTPGVSARARVIGAALALLGEAPGTTPTAVPATRAASLAVVPTPFNPTTVVTFSLPRAGADATVKVYDVRGALVRTLHDGHSSAAELRLEWNGRDDAGATVGSGVYFVRGVTDGFDQTRKVMLVK